LESFQLRAQEAEVRLGCQGPACTAHLDKARFMRVIENLLANSLDALAGQEGGQVELAWAPRDGGVEISVADNGKGIPKKIQKRIFEPFFSHGKVKGTGLGMATVKKIVEEHGGTVEVQSEEGAGTRVLLFLPNAVSEAAEADATGRFPIIGEQAP